MTLRDALYEVMQRTRDDTPEGAEFTNSGDWEQWTEVILSDPAFREALVEAFSDAWGAWDFRTDEHLLRENARAIVAGMLGDEGK